MATCAATTLMHSAREYNGLSDQQLQVLKLALLRQILIALDPMANISASALMASADEFNAMSDHVLQVLQTQLLCEISATGVGGGGAGGVLSGSGVPVAAPTSSSAIYIDKNPAALTVLYWWSGTAWVPFG